MEEPYRDRRHAGAELARRLGHLKGRSDLVVLALARGGVPVACEVARALDAPVDVFVVRKLGLPGHPEYALGAIASGGVRVLNDDAVRLYGIPNAVIDRIAREEHLELERRERTYREGRPPIDLRRRVVVLIDDGLATGSTMRAAVRAVRAHAPATVIVAVPVGSPDTCRELRRSPTRSSARGRRITSPRSASGTTTFGRRRMTKCARCCTTHPSPLRTKSDEQDKRPRNSSLAVAGVP